MNNEKKDLAKVQILLNHINPDVIYLSGEPSIYEELTEIINIIKNMNYAIIITTNGAKFDIEFTKKVLDLNIGGIIVSLDGPDAKTHNYARQEFDKVILGLRNIINYRNNNNCSLKVGVCYVIHAMNLGKFEETVKFVISEGVDYFFYQPVNITKKEGSELILNKEMLSKMMNVTENTVNKYNKYIRFPVLEYRQSLKNIIEVGKFIHSCYGGKYFFFLDEKLALRSCPTPPSKQHILKYKNYRLKPIPCEKESVNCTSVIELIRTKFPFQ